ncbi:uncharacterized protein MONBRDRAFT_3616, partial [Monosiga brevicollis MX1]
KVFVGGIPYEAREQDLLRHFERYSPLSANVILERETNRSRGFGFVTFADRNTASEAMRAMHNSFIGDRQVR